MCRMELIPEELLGRAGVGRKESVGSGRDEAIKRSLTVAENFRDEPFPSPPFP